MTPTSVDRCHMRFTIRLDDVDEARVRELRAHLGEFVKWNDAVRWAIRRAHAQLPAKKREGSEGS
jgi:hypothetical protein